MPINRRWLPILLATINASGCGVTSEQPFPFDNPFLADMPGADKQHQYSVDDSRCMAYANDGIKRQATMAVDQARRARPSGTNAKQVAGNPVNTSDQAQLTSRDAGSDIAIFARDQMYSGCMADRGWYLVDVDLGN